MNDTRFSQYRVMWIMVFFDLPTETKKQVRDAAQFRKSLMQDGFCMFQFSIYIRHCASRENMEVHIRRVRSLLPDEGKVGVLGITDKQFSEMQLFYCRKPKQPTIPGLQLELF